MSLLNKKCKILAVFAHREDHIVFGWPVLQNNDKNIKKYLLTCVKEHNEIIKNGCILENINYTGNCGFQNGFAKPHSNIHKNKFLPNNYDFLKDEIKANIAKIKPDFLFTHNPMGEYGHYDHRMIFEVVCNEFNIPILITDIMAKSSYYKHHEEVPKLFKHCYTEKVEEIEPDIEFYKRNAALFERSGLWTQNENLNLPDYPKKTNLYIIR